MQRKRTRRGFDAVIGASIKAVWEAQEQVVPTIDFTPEQKYAPSATTRPVEVRVPTGLTGSDDSPNGLAGTVIALRSGITKLRSFPIG